MIVTYAPAATVGIDARHRPTQFECLRAHVRAALQKSGHWSVAELTVDICDGTIVLSGVLASFYLKQVAQEAVMRLGTVHEIRNQVDVVCRYRSNRLPT